MIEKAGISLIVLVITIVVIIILTSAIVLNIMNNNPITKANEAVLKSNVASIKENVDMYILSNYTAKGIPLDGVNPQIGDIMGVNSYNDKYIIKDGVLYCTKSVSPEESVIASDKGIKQIVYLNNLLINSDFSNGLNNWSAYNSNRSIVSIGGINNMETINTTSVSYTFGTLQTIYSPKIGKYYTRANMKWESNYYTSSDSFYLKIETPGFGNGPSTVNPMKSSYYLTSGIQQYSYTTNLNAFFRVNSLSLQNYDSTKDTRVYINSPMLINLTEDFGVGNEPSVSELDQISFFTKESGAYTYIR